MKRLICILLALTLCFASAAIIVSAATATASLTGPNTVRAGDTITLSFKLNGSGLQGASGTLSYDKSQLDFVSITQKVASPWLVELVGSNFVAYDNALTSPINKNTEIFTVTFKVKNLNPGTNVKVSFTGVIASDGSVDANIGTVTYSATIAEPMSTKNDLASLTVKNATISPAFDPSVTSYTAEVPFSVSKLEIEAKGVEKTTVTVDNPNLIPGGTTTVKITVKAENGATKTYTITVKREQDPNYQASGNNSLSGITVDGFLLSPVFTAENTQYVIWLPYETESVTVTGTAEDGKASVEVVGGEALEAGKDNVIKVICTAENGETKEYTVVAKRAAAHGEQPETSEDEASVPEESVPATSVPETSPEASQPGTEQPSNGGVQAWIVAVIAIACLAAGIGVGIVISKKK